MAKTVSVAELAHGAVSRTIREAQQQPVLVSLQNRPAAWILSADKLAQVAAARGKDAEDAYQQALELISVECYRQGCLTLGQAAKLAGMALGDFVDLCSRLDVPVLWEPVEGIEHEVERLEGLLQRPGGES